MKYYFGNYQRQVDEIKIVGTSRWMVRHGYDDDVSETKELNPKSQHCFDVSSQIPKRRSSGKFSLHFLVEKMNITYNSERKAPIP